MQTLDTQKHALEGNLKRAESQLETQQKKAAAIERKGTKIPQPMLDEIKATQAQIQLLTARSINMPKKKGEIKAEFEADIERYKILKPKQIRIRKTER